MTIDKMIEDLERIKKKYGNLEVFFDCPYCNKSYTPNTTVAVAAHMTETKNDNK